jgi:hypothetical protein
MKNRDKKDIEAALLTKGFQSRVSDHTYFIYHTHAGQKTLIKTKTSLGNKPKTIGGDLLHAMAQQCKLTNEQFLQLVDCPLTRDQYEGMLQGQGLI